MILSVIKRFPLNIRDCLCFRRLFSIIDIRNINCQVISQILAINGVKNIMSQLFPVLFTYSPCIIWILTSYAILYLIEGEESRLCPVRKDTVLEVLLIILSQEWVDVFVDYVWLVFFKVSNQIIWVWTVEIGNTQRIIFV